MSQTEPSSGFAYELAAVVQDVRGVYRIVSGAFGPEFADLLRGWWTFRDALAETDAEGVSETVPSDDEARVLEVPADAGLCHADGCVRVTDDSIGRGASATRAGVPPPHSIAIGSALQDVIHLLSDGVPRLAKDIASELKLGSRSCGAVRKRIQRLRKLGFPIEHKRNEGYLLAGVLGIPRT